ncbi:hypothetical protein Krad_2003 [Kineococcus radiotolerans SRS30216 = ATCC BAA-149]|uniref:Uncharacterized protein n=1 Tax=Kineococcus radiotolerans (strain ATCC BAA-149 / DSM 14245 / SRS30216) TaxID=266940 RepID=A6W9J9_KINRD|nr:hypothetical protein Krad_2003 [Kineococcus radiotolerans SRS30216 = ATCC BAA-149]
MRRSSTRVPVRPRLYPHVRVESGRETSAPATATPGDGHRALLREEAPRPEAAVAPARRDQDERAMTERRASDG